MPRNLAGVPLSNIQANYVKFAWFVKIEIPASTFLYYTDKDADYVDGGALINGTDAVTWSTYDVKVGTLVQNQTSPLDVSYLDIQNLDNVWSNYVLNTGTRYRSTQIYFAWFDPITDILLGSMIMFDGRTDEATMNGNRIRISLVPHRTPWTHLVPARRFIAMCQYLYKDPLTCQSTSTDATCARTFAACGSHTGGNSATQTTRFGGFTYLPPPNFKLVWGNIAVTLPNGTNPGGAFGIQNYVAPPPTTDYVPNDRAPVVLPTNNPPPPSVIPFR